MPKAPDPDRSGAFAWAGRGVYAYAGGMHVYLQAGHARTPHRAEFRRFEGFLA